MKRTFTIETGRPDSNGDVIKLDGVTIPDKVLITLDFDRSKVIGEAEVKIVGDELKATAEIPDEMIDKYPAIGFSVRKCHEEGAGKVYDEIDLQWVGLCAKENTNPDIKTIREQTKDQ